MIFSFSGDRQVPGVYHEALPDGAKRTKNPSGGTDGGKESGVLRGFGGVALREVISIASSTENNVRDTFRFHRFACKI